MFGIAKEAPFVVTKGLHRGRQSEPDTTLLLVVLRCETGHRYEWKVAW